MSDSSRAEAKANAKAAKAYAKAQRPWYRKKRWIGSIGVVAIVAAVSLGSGGGDTGGGAAVAESGNSASDPGADKKDKPFKVGQTVELEGTQYTVTKTNTTKELGPNFMSEKADGTFVVVSLTVENKKNETKTFTEAATQYVAKDGTKYDTSTDGSMAVAEDSMLLKEMQPNLPTNGKLVFDVPDNAVSGGQLKVEDIFGGGDAHIKLGL